MMGWRLAHLPVLLAVTGALLVVSAIVGGVVSGGVGAAGAAAGVGIVTGSYLFSTLLIAWADSVDPQLVLPVGLTAYAVKFTVIGMGMAAVAASGWAGLVPLGVGVVVAVLAWTSTHIWWLLNNQPRLEYTSPGGAEGPSEKG
jgi:hypothetical protein